MNSNAIQTKIQHAELAIVLQSKANRETLLKLVPGLHLKVMKATGADKVAVSNVWTGKARVKPRSQRIFAALNRIVRRELAKQNLQLEAALNSLLDAPTPLQTAAREALMPSPEASELTRRLLASPDSARFADISRDLGSVQV